jgi:hypothetical protein
MSDLQNATWRVVDDGEAVEIAIDHEGLATTTLRVPTELVHEMYARARSQQLGVDARGDL